jgi:hypothetical protein
LNYYKVVLDNSVNCVESDHSVDDSNNIKVLDKESRMRNDSDLYNPTLLTTNSFNNNDDLSEEEKIEIQQKPIKKNYQNLNQKKIMKKQKYS